MRVFIMSTRENLLGVDRTQVDDEIFVFHIIGRRLNSWRFSVCNILSPIIHTHIVYHPYVSFESSHYHPGPISSLHLIFQFSSIIGFFFALVFFFSPSSRMEFYQFLLPLTTQRYGRMCSWPHTYTQKTWFDEAEWKKKRPLECYCCCKCHVLHHRCY